MDIERCDLSMVPALAAAYNRGIAGVPHCHPVGDADFAAALAPAVGAAADAGRLDRETVFAARVSGDVRGFAHLGVERPKRDGDPARGIIRFLWYGRGERKAGQALLTAGEEYLSDSVCCSGFDTFTARTVDPARGENTLPAISSGLSARPGTPWTSNALRNPW